MTPAILINGHSVAAKINARTLKKIKALKKKNIIPRLEVILAGEDKPSQTYVRRKGEAAKKLGIDFKLHALPASITLPELVAKIKAVQTNRRLSGLIVQLPLPEPLYTPGVLNAIRPELDVDCLTDVNLGKLIMNTTSIFPPTPAAILAILKAHHVTLPGKNVTVIGQGALVGKPLTVMLVNAGASVTTVNSRTRSVAEKCRAADIIITGVGKKNLVRGAMVSPGTIVIDAGVDFVNGKMYGDVNVAEVSKKSAFVTPTPGGVGPVTVAMLLANTVACAEKKYPELPA